MKKKVCFVHPRMPWQFNHFSDPPLGLLGVAASLREEHPTEIEVLLADMGCSDQIPKADIYAMGGTTLEFPVLNNMAARIKKERPDSKLILGGVHVDVTTEESWKKNMFRSPFDIICRGEGEYTVHKAVEAIELGKIKEVITQQGLLDLEKVPFPAYDLLNLGLYFKEGITFSQANMDNGKKSATAMFSRGCPYSCGFCASPTLHKRKLRFRSEDQVKEELLYLKNYHGVGTLRLQDDNIPLTLRKMPGLGQFLRENEFRSRASLRVDKKSCNPDTLEELWDSGFRELGFGIESVEQSILDLNCKGTTVDQGEEAIKMAKEYGFSVRTFLMSGLPGEKADSGKKLADWINKMHLYIDVVTLTNFIPLPGTSIYSKPQEYGIKILDRGWDRYNIAIARERHKFPFVHEIEGLSRDQMTDNLEQVKAAVFNRNLSNVRVYNSAFAGDKYVPELRASK